MVGARGSKTFQHCIQGAPGERRLVNLHSTGASAFTESIWQIM
jgi:hypothetical protein